jgi:protein-tyrosine-phosphatase
MQRYQRNNMARSRHGRHPSGSTGQPVRSAEPFRLVFVCTANRCRSPMAEHLARRSLEKRHIPAEVSSVGRLKGGLGATPGAAEAMARRKLDLSNHVSAQLGPEVLADAHLVLVMERGHLSDVYQTLPDAIDHAFTLGEFPSLLRTTKRDPSLNAAATRSKAPAGELRWPTRRGIRCASWSTTRAPTSPTRWAAGRCTTDEPPSSWQASSTPRSTGCSLKR